jgi:hypothetical protein
MGIPLVCEIPDVLPQVLPDRYVAGVMVFDTEKIQGYGTWREYQSRDFS